MTKMIKIRRFPRLLKDYPDAPLTKAMKISMQLAANQTPRGYDKLTKRQKKLARLVINGMTVHDACRKLGMDTNTYYRYVHYHPLFKKYYLHYAEKVATEIEGRLDAKAGRAIQIIEEALDNPDYYFAHDAAVKFLSGRGYYKKNVEQKSQVSKAIRIDKHIKYEKAPVDKEILSLFVDALGKLSGGVEVRPKIIDAKVVKKVIGKLPEPAPNASSDSEIQKVSQAKTA